MTLHPDPHDARDLAALHPMRVVPGRPRRHVDDPAEARAVAAAAHLDPGPHPDPGVPVQLDTRHDRSLDANVTSDAEHRARLAVCHHHTGDPAGALEALQMLGLVDERGRPVTIGRVGQLSDGIRD